eukprot:TRINITY_DN2109_c0_g1_i1.p1 TRINITY_DN2109_c0_g1~~TRINITY_DN2109_c0_g1_i1.p1  ORF type:complete len:445 (-),score=55.50 TRINITY_DN2109_c0_g1_i1:208-1443(-)
MAAEPSDITRCTSGAADILGARKAFTVQVCNLFGAKCWMNHPAITSGACGTEALEIDPLTCKLYPIFEFADNGARVAGSATEEMSTLGDLGCTVSSSNGVYKWSGACVSVQCDLGSGSYAGPATTGSSSSRTTGIADTSSSTFQSHTLASISSDADQIKNVFLYRTGGHVATYSRGASGSSNSISYSVGELPTSDGNNYGPVVCPNSNILLTSSTAAGITAENLRMCGSTGKWVYYNAINLLKDTSLYATYSGDSGSTADINIGAVPFLAGKSAYRSGTAMGDPRAVKLLSDAASSSAVLMTSETITPQADGAATGETAGTWRNYGVVFYCDDFARTDLTACTAANQKMFYVGDPNPNATFGTSAGPVGGAATPTPAPSATPTPLRAKTDGACGNFRIGLVAAFAAVLGMA